MSDELREYIRAIAESWFDLLVGYTVGSIIDLPFNKPGLLPVSNMDSFWKVLALVLMETAVTATGLIGVRRLMYNRDGEGNIMGGMFFSTALVMSQPGFAANLASLWHYIRGVVRREPPSQSPVPAPVENH